MKYTKAALFITAFSKLEIKKLCYAEAKKCAFNVNY